MRNGPYRAEASVPFLCDRLTDRVKRKHQAVGYPVTLIGWSLGGFLSPTIGGPKYTAAELDHNSPNVDHIEVLEKGS